MDDLRDTESRTSSHKWLIFLALAAVAVAVGVLDLYSHPLLDVEILYFIPITVTAWQLGRAWAWAIVALDVIPTYLDLMSLVAAGALPYGIAVIDIVVRIVVYAFVAEMVYRLVRARRELNTATERLNQAYQERETDIRAASALQRALFDQPIPSVPGFDVAGRLVYARVLGGDFWEAVRLNDCLHLAVADVAGKSIPAALFTTLLEHLLDEARAFSRDPSMIVSYVNSQLMNRLPESMFVTLFYGSLDIEQRLLTYVVAGHEPPLLYRRDDESVIELGVNIMVMGLRGYDEHPESHTAALEPGDILLVYSDGLIEAKKPSGERLNTDFLKQMIPGMRDLSADEIVEEIIREVEQTTESAHRDDMTLVCVKALPPD
jgi:phosphoserine phosphatase RsbU/P